MYPGRLDEIIEIQKNRVFFSSSITKPTPTFLPVLLTGGIGDAILSIATLRRLKREGFELFVASKHAKAFKYFYSDIDIHEEMPDFTWHLELDSIARFKFQDGFTGFLLEDQTKLFDRQRKWFSHNPTMEHLILKHPRDKFLLTRRCKELGVNALMLPILSLGLSPHFEMIAMGWRRKQPALNYITIHDGYDANYVINGRATKTWDWAHWNSFVRKFKHAFPEIEVVQVGSKTSRLIDGVDRNLVNKTSLTEAFDVISQSRLHIDADSGLVHAATAMGIPCVAMFGPTCKDFYGHIENTNISRETSCSGVCFHLTLNWMRKCPVGYDSPKCMDDILPEEIMAAVTERLL